MNITQVSNERIYGNVFPQGKPAVLAVLTQYVDMRGQRSTGGIPFMVLETGPATRRA